MATPLPESGRSGGSFTRRFRVIALTVLGCVLVMAACVYASMRVSQLQGRQAVVTRSLGSAGQVLRKADATSEQMRSAIERLSRPQAGGPCGPNGMSLMHKVTIGSSNLRAIGHVEGDVLICSTLGEFGAGVELGPPVFITSNGLAVRTGVTLPGLEGQQFMVGERDGVAAFANQEMPLDLERVFTDVTLGTFSRTNGKAIRSRLPIQTEWVLKVAGGQDAAVIDGDDVVVLHPSPDADYVAYVAVPAKLTRRDIQRVARTTMPVGILIGVLLCFGLTLLIRRMTSMAAALGRALHGDGVFMQYQPIIELSSGRCVGAEALMRWRRDDGLVPPDHFIAAAEQGGIIQRVTARVVQLVEADAVEFLRENTGMHISINLSAADLRSPQTVAILKQMLADTGLPPHNFWVEATESGFLDGGVAKQIVDEVRALGIRVAIDDFGTGYSSLAYLSKFHLDLLKLDKRFVDGIGTDGASDHVVTHVIELAKSLGLDVVAEGVETEAQAAFLRERGVQYAQGWLFGRPGDIGKLKECGAASAPSELAPPFMAAVAPAPG